MRFHLRYELTRMQRLTPHLAIWDQLAIAAIGITLLPLVLGATISGWIALLALGPLFVFRGLYIGLIDVLVHPRAQIDLMIEPSGIGVAIRNDRLWSFLDGVVSITRHRDDIWTVQHWNGTVFNIPVEAISDEALGMIRAGAERRTDPATIASGIERGQRIEELLKNER